MSQMRLTIEFGMAEEMLDHPLAVSHCMERVTAAIMRSCAVHKRSLVWPSVVVRNKELLPRVPVPGEFRLDAITVSLP